MSSDLYVLDGSFYNHSSPEIVSSDHADLFLSDNPLSPFCDIFQELSNHTQNNQFPVHDSNLFENLSPTILSSSPPSHQLESLTLYNQTTHLQQQQPREIIDVPNLANLGNENGNFSGLDVKIEECKVGFDTSYSYDSSFMPHSYSGVENVERLMQRSYSSNSFDSKPGFLFQLCFDTLLESPNYQSQAFTSPESSFFAGQLRRVCSTGDLHNLRTGNAAQRSVSRPLASDSSFADEPNFKVGRYSAEERKERISKYRAKRNQRNFTKTIKYACRKTLADNRPRIRGRFAGNDEIGDISKATASSSTTTRDEDEEDLWFDGLHEDEDETSTGGGAFVKSCFGQPQFQYYGYCQ